MMSRNAILESGLAAGLAEGAGRSRVCGLTSASCPVSRATEQTAASGPARNSLHRWASSFVGPWLVLKGIVRGTHG